MNTPTTPPANAEATEAVAKPVPPKYYIASKTKHAEFWRANRAGDNNVTSTWIDEAGEGETADYSELSSRCLAEIQAADFLILYCEKGEVLKGALIEAGMALALGKPVRCVGDCESISRVFKEHPLWSSHPSILDAVAQQIRAAQPTPSGPTAGDSMDAHYVVLKAERDRYHIALDVIGGKPMDIYQARSLANEALWNTEKPAPLAEIERLKERLARLEKVLQDRVGALASGQDPIEFALEEYVRAEDHLPEYFDSEDYSLSDSVAALTAALTAAETKAGAMEEALDEIKEALPEDSPCRHPEITGVSLTDDIRDLVAKKSSWVSDTL